LSSPKLSVGFLSLGCPKNLVDSQLMAESLLEQGLALSPSPETADVIIVNTCAFIEDARSESLDAIEAACAHKADGGTCRAVLVAGCMPQRYQKRLLAACPQVDAFIGLDQIDQAGSIIRQAIASNDTIFSVSSRSQRIFEPKGSVVFSSGAHAFLKIAEGCNHGCAFCAIPGIRGRLRSRTIGAVVDEARMLLQKGFLELDLIAQDIMAYGKDLDQTSSLTSLLDALAGLGDHFWIRLLYGYPSLLSDRLLDTMAAHRVICNYLDIPIQHSHPEILKAMRRAGTIKPVESMASRIRSVLPDATLRTTALVGFPGETPAHFNHLREYLAAAEFDHLGVFCYSAEESTPAAAMPHPVPIEVAQERQAILMQDQRKRVQKRMRKRKGETARVLIDGQGAYPAERRARHAGQAPDVDGIVRIQDAPAAWKAGMFATVRFSGFRGYDLLAQPV
jgi:ribosomal protein S12 methylthiotransferase